MRLIDANALKAFIRNQYFQCDMPEEWGNGVIWATSQINHYCNKVAPSIDIEPKRGEWIDKGWKGDWQFETDGRGNCWHEYECSECGFHNKGGKSNFCPNCGADMREREGE